MEELQHFTIVTPVLNQANNIEDCIVSVLEQDCNVQHIIMDGGSTDGTVDIIRKYDKHIAYWESGTDSGQSDAINKGLNRASGTYFNWLNADDQLTTNALNTVQRLAQSNTDVIIGNCKHIDASGKQLAVGRARLWKSVEATLGNYSMGQPSVFYRTAIVKKLGGLNPHLHYCMDMDLWFRFLINYGQQNILETDEVLSQFLVHPNSKTVANEREMRAEKYGVYRVLLNQYAMPPVIRAFLADYPAAPIAPNSYATVLNHRVLLANFCWHLLLNAYAEGNISKSRELFSIVSEGNRLSTTQKWAWQIRLAVKQFLSE